MGRSLDLKAVYCCGGRGHGRCTVSQLSMLAAVDDGAMQLTLSMFPSLQRFETNKASLSTSSTTDLGLEAWMYPDT